jgi:hypothetical protein
MIANECTLSRHCLPTKQSPLKYLEKEEYLILQEHD